MERYYKEYYSEMTDEESDENDFIVADTNNNSYENESMSST